MISKISSNIRINTVGFLPFQEKRASIAMPCNFFWIIDVNTDKKVFEGKVIGPILNEDTDEELYLADFSEFKEPGKYLLRVDDLGDSPEFEIGESVYLEPFRAAMIGMYLWRCGTSVKVTYKGITYSHDECHTDDAWMDYVGGGHKKRNSCGGWHDAGDYNKYVVNAGISLSLMYMAWEQFGNQIKKVNHLPEEADTGFLPQFLQEIKWEIDWLFSMQMENGAVSHKVSTKDFCGFIMPEQEKNERYFTGWGTTATADFVALLAAASRIFKPYDIEYSEICLKAAQKSYGFLLDHPENIAPDQTGFETGTYAADDYSHRLWAAAEMWECTGERWCLEDFESRALREDVKIDEKMNWKNVKNLGMIRYLFSTKKGKNQSLVDEIRLHLLKRAQTIVETRNKHGYGRPLGNFYCWGSNSDLLNQVLLLQYANRIEKKDEFINTALDAIGFVFGRNRYGRSFVTGVGFNPPLFPHDRRSGADSIEQPWPGYLVGGPAENANDYQDSEPDCKTNEIAINWNAALIYALAGFI